MFQQFLFSYDFLLICIQLSIVIIFVQIFKGIKLELNRVYRNSAINVQVYKKIISLNNSAENQGIQYIQKVFFILLKFIF